MFAKNIYQLALGSGI